MPDIEQPEPSASADDPSDHERSMDDATNMAPNRIALAGGKALSQPGLEEPAIHARHDSEPPSIDAGDVPPAVAARYLVETSRWTGRRDYFESSAAPDAAFHDRGGALVSKSDSPAIIADMVAIAQHRRWETLDVAGSEAFRREAWFRATAIGLEVNGYHPTERELQDVSRRTGRASALEVNFPPVDPAGRTDPSDLHAASRQYLSVPFADKDAAKQAGAKWDRETKSWYVDGDDRSAVQRWVPGENQARTEKVIAADPNARAQLRAIEAVVGATLADNPEAQRRVLEAGRETLAERVSQDKAIHAPRLKASDRTHDKAAAGASPVQPGEPALPQRRAPERTRGR